jgi:hypothetical protein
MLPQLKNWNADKDFHTKISVATPLSDIKNAVQVADDI